MLRWRLPLLVVAALLLAALAFGLAVDRVFWSLQRGELEGLLERELARVAELVRTSSVGVPFVTPERGGVRLQFVDRDGVVVLPPDDDEPLPAEGPVWLGEGPLLSVAGATPWALPSGREIGTIRIELDASSAWQARRSLRASLLGVGIATAGLTALVGYLATARALRPLSRLAAQARALDPAAPVRITHRGPDDEVAALAHALDAAFEGIEARRVAEREALAEVSHELAAPLTVVAGRLETLAEEALAGAPGEERAADPRLLAARDAARELLHVSRDLLVLARGELEGELELQAVDLAEVAGEVAAQYDVRLDAPAAPEEREVLGDRGRLAQVARNLLRNAVQAAGEGGVRARVRRDGAEVRLEVEDDGPGIEPDALPRVFERGVTGRAAAGGRGLGLAVATRIAERHEGRIEASSEPGRGSVFALVLPALEEGLEPA